MLSSCRDSSMVRLPFVFSCSTTSRSIVWRAMSRFGAGASSASGPASSIWTCIPRDMMSNSKLAVGIGGACDDAEKSVAASVGSAGSVAASTAGSVAASFCVSEASGLSTGSPSAEKRLLSFTLMEGFSSSSLILFILAMGLVFSSPRGSTSRGANPQKPLGRPGAVLYP